MAEPKRVQWTVRVGDTEVDAFERVTDGIGPLVPRAQVQRAALRIGLEELASHKSVAKRLERITAALED